MTPQTIKIINQEDLGASLKKLRGALGVSLEKTAEDLKIPLRYLEALENNRLNDLPGGDYAKKILISYVNYLRGDFKTIWPLAKKIIKAGKRRGRGLEQRYFLVVPRFVKKTLAVLLVLGILIFLLWKVEQIFAPPPLKIIEPPDGLITSDRQLKIVGQSQAEVEIVINNKPIFVDNQGNFTTTVDLQNGLNLIKIIAQKRYGQLNSAEVRVLLKELNK